MKKISAQFITVLLLISMLLTACGGNGSDAAVTTEAINHATEHVEDCSHQWNALKGICKVCEAACPHDEWTSEAGQCITCKYRCTHEDGHTTEQICETCGKLVPHSFMEGECICGLTTQFECEVTPDAYTTDCDQPGTVEELLYDTFVYDAAGQKGEAVQKRMYVYLPYNYSAENTYNVLYLLHGTGETEGYWLGMGGAVSVGAYDVCLTRQVLDNLIKNGEMEPTIVVTPTIYTNEEMVASDVFHFELMNDIVPAVESKYSTYANGDVSRDSLIASRDHRALAGLSAGSGRTQSSLPYVLEYISWFGCMSGASGDAAEYLASFKDKVTAGYKINYFYHGCGFADTGIYENQKQLALGLIAADPNHEVFTEDVNFVWVEKNNNAHTYQTWLSDLFNIARVFFKNNDK